MFWAIGYFYPAQIGYFRPTLEWLFSSDSNNVTHMNREAMDWYTRKNASFHKSVYGVPQDTHFSVCAEKLGVLEETSDIRPYLCPLRKISFDGFVNYENRRFGVPGSYTEPTARVMRNDNRIYIYSTDLSRLLTTHDVTWSPHDSFCEDQYVNPGQPEEFPTVPPQSRITMLRPPISDPAFEKFNVTIQSLKRELREEDFPAKQKE